MSPALHKRALEALPKCKTCADAERELGGEFQEDRPRDFDITSQTWGYYDGFRGYDPLWPANLPQAYRNVYLASWREGRAMATRKVA